MAVEAARDPDAFRAFEREGWQRASAAYLRSWARVTEQTIAPLLDAAGAGADSNLLDVCCGPGAIAGAALERGAAARGIDLSENFVAIARQRYPSARFDTGDAEDLPFPDRSFDSVVSGYGIIHVPRPAVALAEMMRVLRPGGRLAVSVWSRPVPGTGLGVVFAAIKEHADTGVPLPHGPDFFQFSDPDSLADILSAAGLASVSVSRVEQTFRPDDAEDFYAMIDKASVRMSGLLHAQPPERLASVRAAIDRGLQALPDPGAISMPALVAAGRKPG